MLSGFARRLGLPGWLQGTAPTAATGSPASTSAAPSPLTSESGTSL